MRGKHKDPQGPAWEKFDIKIKENWPEDSFRITLIYPGTAEKVEVYCGNCTQSHFVLYTSITWRMPPHGPRCLQAVKRSKERINKDELVISQLKEMGMKVNLSEFKYTACKDPLVGVYHGDGTPSGRASLKCLRKVYRISNFTRRPGAGTSSEQAWLNFVCWLASPTKQYIRFKTFIVNKEYDGFDELNKICWEYDGGGHRIPPSDLKEKLAIENGYKFKTFTENIFKDGPTGAARQILEWGYPDKTHEVLNKIKDMQDQLILGKTVWEWATEKGIVNPSMKRKRGIIEKIKTEGLPKCGTLDYNYINQCISDPRLAKYDAELRKIALEAGWGQTYKTEKYRRENSIRNGGRPFKDENGNIYYTYREASESLGPGVHKSKVGAVLNGKRRHAGGHTFTYLDPK